MHRGRGGGWVQPEGGRGQAEVAAGCSTRAVKDEGGRGQDEGGRVQDEGGWVRHEVAAVPEPSRFPSPGPPPKLC